MAAVWRGQRQRHRHRRLFIKCYAHIYVHFSHPAGRTPNNSLPIPQNEQILLIRLQNLIHFIDIVYSNGNIIVPCVGSLQCVHFTSAVSKAVSIVNCFLFLPLSLSVSFSHFLSILFVAIVNSAALAAQQLCCSRFINFVHYYHIAVCIVFPGNTV